MQSKLDGVAPGVLGETSTKYDFLKLNWEVVTYLERCLLFFIGSIVMLY